MRASVLIAAVMGMTFESEADKQRPVNRVINLLKDMQKTLEKEKDEDQEVYDKLACWCKTNDSEKTKAIETAEQRITQLTSAIQEYAARSSELTQTIKQTREDLAGNKQALAAATAQRRKESSSFTSEEKDAIQAVSALKGAITVLKRHNSLSQASLIEVQKLMNKYPNLLPAQRRQLSGFLQQPNVQSYSNQSGEIFGMLEQMLENFQANLSENQKEELAAQETYNLLRAAKEDEIKAGKERLDTKLSELADVNNKNSDAKEDLEDTQNALSSDQKFLMDLKKRCKSADEEFAERSKTRQDELLAVADTITILTNDQAHEKLGQSLSFVEIGQKAGDLKRRAAAAKVLRAAGKDHPELMALAVSAKLDAFVKVKKAIDDMITQLKKEGEDEIVHRDWCNTEFNENEDQTAKANRNKEEFESLIEDLSSQMETLTKEIHTLQAEIAEAHVQTQRAAEDRQEENKEFQTTIVDQRDTQEILKQAINRLQQFYDKKATELVQTKQEPGAAAPPPPEGFKEYKKNKGASGVLGMIQEIVNDSKMIVQEATKGEQDAQTAYEEFIADTTKAIAQRQRSITNKTSSRAQAEQDKASADGSLRGTMKELENLNSYNGELHKSCDFTIKNFDIRQTARDQEVEALQQAKSILSGADFQ